MSLRSRSRSRSPIGNSASSNITSAVLHLYNIPKSWNYEEVKGFIKEKNRTISFGLKYVKIVSENNKRKGECLLKFANAGVCKKGYELLNGALCKGQVIRAEPTLESVPESVKHENTNSYQVKQQQNATSNALKEAIDKIKLQVESMKPSANLQTYGLSINFLDSLGIKLPLLDKVFIANLDTSITEEKIREVFGHAGQIVSLQLFKNKKNEKKQSSWAKVEYDHPVEAVQAISMLHDRELFGKKLIVQMDTNPRLFQKHVPEGLSGFGPGLGENGSVLKGVRTTVELLLLKNLPKEQNQSDIQNVNQDTMNQQMQVDPMAMLNMQSSMNNMMPVNQNATLLGLQTLLNPQMQHGMYQAGSTDLMTALATLQGQGMAAPAASVPIIAQPVMAQSQMSDWSQGQSLYNSQNQQPDNADDQYGYLKPKSQDRSRDRSPDRSSRYESENQSRSNSKQKRSEGRGTSNHADTDMLVFNNLPASVTLQALNSKMREVGEVKFAEITGQGRAIVRFFSPRDAERCINLFDRSKVDGQTIDVRFF